MTANKEFSTKPDHQETFADFLDGTTANVLRAGVTIHESPVEPALHIAPPGKPVQIWPLSAIRHVPDQASKTELIVARAGDPVARLIVRDLALRSVLVARCRHLRRRPPVPGKARLAIWALAAVASVALIILVLVPVMANQLAEYLPPEGEKALGDTTFQQIRTALDESGAGAIRICDDSAGVAALEKMKSRLTQQIDLPYPVRVHVLDDKLINAFALPGGHVVFFRGLIDAARTPDEVAAVFAHEIGHVAHRDPTRIALRSAGSIGVLGLLLGDFAGGFAVLFLAERLIQATYSKDAEAAADGFAHAQLIAAGIPPSALATMFQRLLDKHGENDGLIAHFTSHPALGDRIAAARVADKGLQGALRPSLGESEWQALRNICQ